MILLSFSGFLEMIFWISLSILFYSYLGYGMLLLFLVFLKRTFQRKRGDKGSRPEPNIAIIIPAFNEESCIRQKIENSLSLEYPSGKLQVVVVSDGSTDNTSNIVNTFDGVKSIHQPVRKGKIAAINRAVDLVESDILVFSDANTLLNKQCLLEIVRQYVDEKTGGVAGEKKVNLVEKGSMGTIGEGLYWQYESFLKNLDSELYTTVGAAGELFSIRKDLFEKIPEDTIIEDFVQSLKLCERGYIVKYAPLAYATEEPSPTLKDEWKRKVRISAGAFQAMILLRSLFNVIKFPLVSFQFISHRVLRWTLCPVALITLLFSNILLVIFNDIPIYEIFLTGQVIFYFLSTLGWISANRRFIFFLFSVPFYFVFMNVALIAGFAKFITRRQTVLWEKSDRHSPIRKVSH